MRVRAQLNATLADGVVAARHGWWPSCPELDLPGYDVPDPHGANVNLAMIGIAAADPVSGAARTAVIRAKLKRRPDTASLEWPPANQFTPPIAERPLRAESADLTWQARQSARRAASGRSCGGG